MAYQITIRKVSNAFVMEWEEDIKCEAAYNFDGDDNNSEREALINSLWHVIEYFNLQYQKHYKEGDKFIKIELVDADKYFGDE